MIYKKLCGLVYCYLLLESVNTNISIIVSQSKDPFKHLAFENWLLRDLRPTGHFLFLYSNDPSVVMGKFQNPWKECDLKLMEENGIALVRRISGGGCVYHDQGNLNFCLISPLNQYDEQKNYQIILKALADWGIKASVSERKDIRFDDYKFSGSAFKRTKDYCLHHGTLLVSADLNRLNIYLSSLPVNMECKSLASVRSKVINLNEINPSIEKSDLIQSIVESFKQCYPKAESKIMFPSDFFKNVKVQDYFEFFKSDEWTWGATPAFKMTSACGRFTCQVEKGKVVALEGEKAKDEFIGQAFFPFSKVQQHYHQFFK